MVKRNWSSRFERLTGSPLSAKLKAAHWKHRVLALFATLEAQQFNRYATVRDDTLRLLGTCAVDFESGLLMNSALVPINAVRAAMQI